MLPTGKPDGLCEACKTLPATVWWSGDASVMDVVHGARVSKWCELCIVEAQIEHSETQARRVIDLLKRAQALTMACGADEIRIRERERCVKVIDDFATWLRDTPGDAPPDFEFAIASLNNVAERIRGISAFGFEQRIQPEDE